MNELTRLGQLKVGMSFTFPKGTEGAGFRYTVIEQNVIRTFCEAEVPAMTLRPQFNYKGSEQIVLL